MFKQKQPIANSNFTYAIESDWSSASFMLVAAAINGNCTFKGLNVFSVQADKKIVEALQAANATMSITETEIEVKKSYLKAFHFDATECPDLFPPLVALAANAVGTTSITGVNRLAHKESNRGLTLQEEFAKLGVIITLQNDIMLIEGKGYITIQNNNCNSHNDHRIAMALAVAVLNANTAITIQNAEAVKKSYPLFFEDLLSLVSN